jgi:hypothetical protein
MMSSVGCVFEAQAILVMNAGSDLLSEWFGRGAHSMMMSFKKPMDIPPASEVGSLMFR